MGSGYFAFYLFRLSTPDEIRSFLLKQAAQQGYVVGARAQYRRDYMGPITEIVAWAPDDTIRMGHTSTLVCDAVKVGKPFVYAVLREMERIVLGSDLTLAPEPTHYLYRVWMDKGDVRRALERTGTLKNMTKTALDLNRDIERNEAWDADGVFKVYPTQMPDRETV